MLKCAKKTEQLQNMQNKIYTSRQTWLTLKNTLEKNADTSILFVFLERSQSY